MNLIRARRQPMRLPAVCGALVLVLLAACGGGGGGGGDAPAPAVTAVTLTTAAPKYRQELQITVDGSNLDQGLSVTAQGCKNIVRSTTAPRVSTASTGFYSCTVSAVGNGQVDVAASAGAAALKSAAFAVAVPQVTLTLNNGGGVNGDVVLTLDPAKAPNTVDNFLDYVNAGFYAGTIFHRVLPGNLVEGGGYLPLNGGTTPVPKAARAPIPLEVAGGLTNLQWTVAMARSAQADSATSRFFVNLVDNPTNDPSPVFAGFAVFGSVTSGIPVVQALAAVACGPIVGFSECAPVADVQITAATQSR